MARISATERLGRILAMVPWIASHDGPLIDDVCERFGVTREELVADLDVVFVVGLYPYTPDNLIEVLFDDERVWISYTNFFERPLKLTRDEALSLLAAGLAARHQPGHDASGPLARGLAKVAAVLGISLDDDLEVVLGDPGSDVLRAVDDAIERHRVLHIEYFTHARNASSERDIEPRSRFAADGAWYLDAFCRSTGEDRVFRLDRVTSVSPTAEEFAPRGSSRPADAPLFDPDVELPRVTLALARDDAWVAEQYPVDSIDDRGDELRVTLAVSARPWLERLLLRLGPGARVIDGPDELVTAGVDAARRLLAARESEG